MVGETTYILLQVSDVEVLLCSSVFSLVLEEHCGAIDQRFSSQTDAGVIIGGVECATLGHGPYTLISILLDQIDMFCLQVFGMKRG
jgi:hypothetical protein